jgi:hypothetical protein
MNQTYARYPISRVLLYNGVTVLHFGLGGAGLILGYGGWAGLLVGVLYMIFAFGGMYVLMPLSVCPNCVYYRMEGGRCISALNLFSRRVAKPGRLEDFPKRAKGIFCSNNLYLAAMAIPIAAIIPALVIDFSFMLLGILLGVVALLLFRFFFLFTRVVCRHCAARKECPQAISMGLSNV